MASLGVSAAMPETVVTGVLAVTASLAFPGGFDPGKAAMAAPVVLAAMVVEDPAV